MGIQCPVCGGVGRFYTNREKDNRSYAYYSCDSCGCLFIEPDVIKFMDAGYSIVSYEEGYWDDERLDGGLSRTFGPNIARMAEVFYYARRPIKRFLDIGGGNGRFLDAVALYLPESKDIFYSVEKYPPKQSECTKSSHFFNCDYKDLRMKFDAGICIEVIEHLTPSMLISLFREVTTAMSSRGGILVNSGQPEYVRMENPQYLEPFKDGHIVSYSLKGLSILLNPLGFNVKQIKGKSWACFIEYKYESKDELVDRVWSPLPENMAILDDAQMGSVMRILGMESIRSYSSAADAKWLAQKLEEMNRRI